MILLPHTLSGKIRLSAMRPDGRLRPVMDWKSNMLLDAGLDEIASVRTYLDACHLGSNAAATSPDQISLLSPVVATANRIQANSAARTSSPWHGSSAITYQFPVGAYVGQLNEIGFGSSASLGSALFSRALVGDRAAPVEFLADEAVVAQYELTVTPPQGNVAGFVDINGASVAYIASAAQVSTTNIWCAYDAASFGASGKAALASFDITPGTHCRVFDGAIGSITGTPGGNSANCTGVWAHGYTAGDNRRVVTLEADPTIANWPGGIRSYYWSMKEPAGAGGNSLGAWQLELATPLIKDAETTFIMDVGISWGRA